ncbi:polysaccharide biosynthesis tyrosine autokinase [Parasphingorhabdus sp.]|uniref:GumC family protein n=1 Tax=Parasphingorhabdus sp. TaxID=2709688 RepID=UPI0032654C59
MNKILPSSSPAPDAEKNARLGAVPLLEQYWRAARNRLPGIAVIIATCLVIGIVITLLMSPQFTSESRIEISRKQDNVTNVEGVQAEELGQDLEFYQTQYALLEARSLAERVARELKLITDKTFFDRFGVDVEKEGLFSGPTRRSPDASERSERLSLASEILLDNMVIEPIRGSSLVDIKFTSPDPKFSAQVANSWVDQFVASTMDRRFSSTTDARDFLERRLSELRQRLEDSERRLVTYASSKAIVTLSGNVGGSSETGAQRTLVAADLESLNAALAEATSARIVAESQARQRSGASQSSLANTAISGIRQTRAEVASERAKLLTQFEPEYPTVKALTSQLEALDQSIADEESRVRSSMNTSYVEALQREAELRRQVEQLKSRFQTQRRDSIQYNIYQREVETNRELYDALLQRFKEIGVAGVGNNNIAVVDRAQVPDEPSSPNLPFNVLLSLIAGLALSGGYVFALEQIDQSLKDPADVQNFLGLSPLGVVPHVDKEDIVTSLRDKKSVASEAYFSIGTSLSFLTDHGVPKSILLTSTRPNEGKSTSAIAIAEVLARMGHKTLLIDADMRNPSVHHFAGINNEAGFSNYLTGQSNLAELITVSENPNLVYMTAGPIPPNAAELLSGSNAKDLVRELSKTFEHVVIDGPPVLGLADAPLLARTVEGVIYTIEANGAKMRSVQTALQRIEAANVTVFGAIVTKLDSRNAEYGYGYSYSYGDNGPGDSDEANG